MTILSIETSCDETAVAIIKAEGTPESTTFTILGNALLSQIEIHREYGGVFPALAKREHAKNIVPLLAQALEEAGMLKENLQTLSDETEQQLSEVLVREPELGDQFLAFIKETEIPAIDAIAVTHGPGLAPALWVGVNFARALSVAWNTPLVGVNHMEGHLLSALAETQNEKDLVIQQVEMPVVALLISGGHTEIDVMSDWLTYKKVGQTRDDAAGEAFDKVARMMDLPYPGGPEISKLAARDREDARTNPFKLPRPMIDTDDCDFSFSGLKTSVLYQLKALPEITDIHKEQMARAFEDAVADVLFAKVARALDETNAETVVLGGGVSGNTHIQAVFTKRIAEKFSNVTLRIPTRSLTTDNAVMIGIAGYYRAQKGEYTGQSVLVADGNLSL